MLLARLGYYTEEEFYNLVYKVMTVKGEDGKVLKDENGNKVHDPRYNPDLDVKYFDYDKLLGEDKVFTWYPNDSIFTKNENPFTSQISPFSYNHSADNVTGEGVSLKVTGILVANEETSYGCLSSGIYYTEALTNHVLDANRESEIVKYVNEKGDITSTKYMGMNVGVYYEYEYRLLNADENGSFEGKDVAFVGKTFGIEDMMSSMGSGGAGGGSNGGSGSGGAGNIDISEMKTISARMLGGVDLANSISVYPNSFDEKSLVTDWLDAWNADEDKANVTYTDTLELIIDMVNTMIKIVSYALIAFTSVSLVVSTVMIGIITYVSVVERIKEIGVIRSLGGRKKDVAHLFNAETFIIGFLAGLIGVITTYLISLAVNLILKPLIGYAHIAALPFTDAIVLITLSVALTLISGLIPASRAAKQDPVVALRTE
jgi:putative ABC transport system permease protein